MSDSKRNILKVTSLIGGSQVFSILFSIIRSKALAILIGPSGIGLIGAFQSSLQLMQKVADLGIGFSAVRSVAKISEKFDSEIISRTVFTVRRVTLITGLFGTLLVILLSAQISKFTFGIYEYAFELKILSVIVFFNILTSGQTALIQGLRRIKDLSKLTILGALSATSLSIPLIYFLGTKGIVPFLITVAVAQLIFSWFYSNKIKIKKIKLTIQEFYTSSSEMIKLGFAFMGSGLAAAASLYLIKVILIRSLNIEAVGFYQAAYTLSALYIGIILDAMGKDFYPRLTIVAENNDEEVKLINEQTEIGILLAAPGLIFTMALAPFIIHIFYSKEFIISNEILRWMILGVFIRVVSWPLGYLFIARAKGKIFFFMEFIVDAIHIILLYFSIKIWGILGSGIAFFIYNVSQLILNYVFVAREISFYWNRRIVVDFILTFILLLISFLILNISDNFINLSVVLLFTIFILFFSIYKIMQIFEIKTYNELYILIKRYFSQKNNQN